MCPAQTLKRQKPKRSHTHPRSSPRRTANTADGNHQHHGAHSSSSCSNKPSLRRAHSHPARRDQPHPHDHHAALQDGPTSPRESVMALKGKRHVSQNVARLESTNGNIIATSPRSQQQPQQQQHQVCFMSHALFYRYTAPHLELLTPSFCRYFRSPIERPCITNGARFERVVAVTTKAKPYQVQILVLGCVYELYS